MLHVPDYLTCSFLQNYYFLDNPTYYTRIRDNKETDLQYSTHHTSQNIDFKNGAFGRFVTMFISVTLLLLGQSFILHKYLKKQRN